MKKLSSFLGKAGSKLLSIVSGLLTVVLISYSGYAIYDSVYTQKAAFSSWDLAQYRPVLEEDGELSFEDLIEVNRDTVGWLTLKGTNIDYPVVQGRDDLEYASKDVFGKSSLSGSIYLTSLNTRDFTNSFNLIYGHHMANGAMFGDIDKYADASFFQSHQEGIVITTLGTYDVHVFARLSTDAYDSKIYTAGDKESDEILDFLEHARTLAVQWEAGTNINDIAERVRLYLAAREQIIAEHGEFVFSEMPQDAIENGLQLLALSTCADATTNGRQLLLATMKIRTEPLPVEVIKDEKVPLAPRGHGQSDFWSIANLVCAALTVLMVVPLTAAPGKYGRVFLMNRSNKREGSEYRTTSLLIRGIIGFLLEVGLALFAVYFFMTRQSFHNPMTIVDEYTPYMIGIFAASVLVDYLCFRYWEKKPKANAVAA